MRGLSTLVFLLGVVALGYWAYHQTILTQQAERRVEQLQRDIGAARERLAILRAEWAYLNRPDRLRELAEFNFERLAIAAADPRTIRPRPSDPLSLPPEPEELLLENASGL
jgi:hypothetical protein